jgi:alcohol dehydrogenase class IV
VSYSVQFDFAICTRILFGRGVSKQLGARAAEFGKRALVVTGRDASRWEGLIANLSEAGIAALPFTVAAEPDLSMIEQGLKTARAGECDFVIAIGGGSALDAGKAIAAMLTNPGALLDYLEVIGAGKPLTSQAAPFVALPTTAGTGSEVTRNAVLASPQHRVKASLRSPLMIPTLAVVDPELTVGLPSAITASTGLDAFTQLIEPVVSSRANPVTDMYCRQGLTCAAQSIRTAVKHGDDLKAREDMCLASLFGGVALANAGLGAVHGFAGPIGGMFPAPHGAICAILLPHVMEMNIHALRERQPQSISLRRYDEVAQILTGLAGARGDDGVEWVKNLVGELAIPRLSAYDVRPEHIPELVQKAAQASSMKANPLPLTGQELSEILTGAI